MDNTFKKGLLLGGLIALVAAVGIAVSKRGEQLTEDTQKDLKAIAKNIEKSLSKLQDITKESFDELVETAVKEYAENKEMAVDAKNTLTQALKDKWEEMEAEFRA